MPQQYKQGSKQNPAKKKANPAAPKQNGNGVATVQLDGAEQTSADGVAQAQQSAARAQARENAAAKQAAREADLAARAERRAKAEAEARRRQQMRTFILAGAAVLVVAVIFVGFMWYGDAHPGESFADQGNQHIDIGATHPAYNSNPPTSGWHAEQMAGWGIKTTMPAIELMVHNLEDGGVNVYYQPDIDTATLDKLKALVGGYGDKVALSPYDGLSDPIVLTAWTKLERFASYDDGAMKKFINAYRGIDHHVQGVG